MIAASKTAAHRLHVAIVYGPDTEPFVTLGRSRDQVVRRLARYVRRSAPDLLWPEDAARVTELLRTGDREGAIDAYFRAVGGEDRKVRWEVQRLVLRQVRCPRDRAVLR
jgi:hypothetical protein